MLVSIRNRGIDDFKAKRAAHYAPIVIDTIMDDEGNLQHILENGNTIPKDRYDALWNVKKTAILPKYYKGENPHKTKV